MNALPVAARELRAASRRPMTYRVRGWAVLIALAVFALAISLATSKGAPASSLGQILFVTMSWVSFIYCLIIGTWATADCLSQEKREGTLGLLFLTDLKSYDVLWGKLAATSLNAVYGLVAILPMLVLPLQLGGVPLQVVWQTALVLGNTMFFSLALGLYISTINHDERASMTITAGTLLLLVIMPGVLAYGLAWYWNNDDNLAENLMPVLATSIAYPITGILVSAFAALPVRLFTPETLIGSALLYHILAWGLLIRSGRLLPHVWQADSKRGWLGRLQDGLEQWGYGQAEKRRQHRARLLDRNPFLWHASRDRMKPWYVWLLLVSVMLTWAWNHRDRPETMLTDFTFLPACMIVNLFLKLWVASEASVRLMTDRRAGALELLLSTPLTIREIIHGQWLALRRQFLLPVCVLLVVEYWGVRTSVEFWPAMFMLASVLLDIGAIGWMGLAQGLKAKNTTQALTAVVGKLLVAPPLVYLVLMLIYTATNGRDPSFNTLVYLWCGLGILFDVLLGFFSARYWLLHEFRQSALR